MSRTLIPYHADDLSALARALKREIDAREKLPGHVEWLNILARATGHRNFQHYKAEVAAVSPLASTPVTLPDVRRPAPEAIDMKRVDAVARCFDDKGVLTRWPAKTNHQRLCLWRLWSVFPAERDLTEQEVNAFLKARNGFGDHVLLRREMVNVKLIDRDRDCRRYRRIEQRPPAEALAVIRARQELAA
ncbi:DUF2087 domain-containing protein [Rhizobium sp. RU36D]|uniref:DUF2087 domain-containing protein n=1 Tax=Rhizobium sp. RU36D TaxID=1907415 RepID=UPI0009D824BF|nr:DUF2087 domain-containing protein [Rhizobium sp. RU36D]SMC96466.1 hypothetical protein SAMN05880593_11264 [Rhizobium sp. RU36D]